MECSLPESPSAYLDALYEEYDGFDIQQTTIGVDREEFEVIANRPDGIAVRVRIEGDGGVVALPDGDGWVLPGGIVDATPDRETVARFVGRWTGIRAEIEELEQVSLVCLQCEPDGTELWTASAVMSATAMGGTPKAGAVWRDPETPVAVPSL